MAAQLRVTYKKSSIGYSQRQKDTVRSLGLTRLGQTVDVPDNLAIRGMVHHVQHLVVFVEMPADAVAAPPAPPTDGADA